MNQKNKKVKYPGIKDVTDGNTAVILCERNASDAAGAYPITPSTPMGELWASETAQGYLNTSNKPLIFIEPEGEHAAAAVTAGMAMTGLRATNFSSGQGIAYMHESLYAAVGKRLTYILNIGCRAMTKTSLNVHAGHDDYHAIDDTGFFQLFAKDVQGAADLNLIAHKIAELSLTPGAIGQDGFLTTHLMESVLIPERELIEEFLGHPDDIIDTPTPAQRLIYGNTRRRIPELWTVDNPVMSGPVQNQDSYMQSVATQRPFFFDHIEKIVEQVMDEFYELTGRRYHRINTYKTDDADYILMGQGSVISSAEVVADYLRKTRHLKIGVVDMTVYRPFPGDLIGKILKGRKGVTILERLDQPLAEDLPLMRETRAAISKCLENGAAHVPQLPYPDYAVYKTLKDAPPLYSSSFGMGSRDLQPEGLIAAVENMLETGEKRKMFYLSIDFVRHQAITPEQESYQKNIQKLYPDIKNLALRGSENPNLMPKDSITVRLHSIGGWGAITTGKNMALTLFDLFGYYIKANPKYGSEKKGQPTTFYLSAAKEPIRLNSEYHYVDVVMSPDPKVFGHSNPLSGLKKGGIFVLQSELVSPEKVWDSIPPYFQTIIEDNEIHFYFIDALKIAKEEAQNPELQFRMQGIAFQGCFFAASPIMKATQLSEENLFKAIENQLNDKFGKKGRRVVEDNLRVVKRGFKEIQEVKYKTLKKSKTKETSRENRYEKPLLPIMTERLPVSKTPTTDIRRFWEQTGNFYSGGYSNDSLADPFIALSLIPASTATFRDMTSIRYEYPKWVAEKCTGCGNCWTVCPDSAIPGLVNDVSEIVETTIRRLEKADQPTRLLKKTADTLVKKLHAKICEANDEASVRNLMDQAIAETITESHFDDSEMKELEKGFNLFKNEMSGFEFTITKPFFRVKEKEAPGHGGLLSITVNPQACKGCMECVVECNDHALLTTPETTESADFLRRNWNYWLDLPNTQQKHIKVENLDEAIGSLETILLDKDVYLSMSGGDGACIGCAEKTVIHLFTATITALMQSRIPKHLEKITSLSDRLEFLIKEKLQGNGRGPDPIRIARVQKTLDTLKNLKWQYTQGISGRGRASLGMINNTGCTTVWASTYPLNPYPFPWANHLFQDAASMAMGVFEGHMRKMADGFKAIRIAELELDNAYDPKVHDEFFTYYNWNDFTDEEFLLSPPVVAMGGDGSMYDIGFQNLSRMIMTGRPIKVMIVDTQVYSNTGGQACTSGFVGQISDMADYGKAHKGKEEVRKEISLIGMAHRVPYILQSSMARISHLVEGFIQGLNAKRPALFNIYTTCPPEHGVGDTVSAIQARLALESRAYPHLSYNPDKGKTLSECCDLEGNPDIDQVWSKTTLKYIDDEGKEASMELPSTFADFAVTEGRFRKHFKIAPRETWNDTMVPVAEFLDMSEEKRKGRFPFVWVIDENTNKLNRVLVSQPIIQSCEERRDFWIMLRDLAIKPEKVDEQEVTTRVQSEMIERLTSRFMQISGLASRLTN